MTHPLPHPATSPAPSPRTALRWICAVGIAVLASGLGTACHVFEDVSSYPFEALQDISASQDTHTTTADTDDADDDADTTSQGDGLTNTADDTLTSPPDFTTDLDLGDLSDVLIDCEPFDPKNPPPADQPVLCVGGGNACCPPAMVCNAATGFCACKDGKGDCNQDLSDGCEVKLDTVNKCGGCDVVCAESGPQVIETKCKAEGCVFDCVDGFGDCDGFQDTGCETHTDSNRLHCGGCGQECGLGQLCINGECECVNPGQGTCGECNLACGINEACVDGACVCPDGFDVCGNFCVNLDQNRFNCGGCGVMCPFGAACIDGQCLCEGQGEPCTAAENEFCCGSVCMGEGEVCCAGGCDSGQACCGGACLNTVNNVEHCGDCGVQCAPNERCQEGRCVCGQSASAPRCTQGFVCTPDGDCVCPDGQQPCSDPNNTGAICVNTGSSAQHCGSCGVTCPPSSAIPGDTMHIAGGQCVGGVCALGCDEHWGDCDGNPANGCETDLLIGIGNTASSDSASGALHCGGCGVRCGLDQVCDGGECVCVEGLTMCGDTCVNVNNDSDHCGTCDNECGVGRLCNARQCCLLGLGGLCR